MSTVATSRFARATAVEPLGDGAWAATCDAAWIDELLPEWHWRSAHLAVPSLDAFRGFATPGWVRVAAAFTVAREGDGSRVGTETRIAATDDAARRRFGRYWRVIGPFSGITRREMLTAIRRRAEADS